MFTKLFHFIGIKKWQTFSRGTCKMKMASWGLLIQPSVLEDIDTRYELQYCDTKKKDIKVRAIISNAFKKNHKYSLVEIVRGLGFDSETLAHMIVAHQKTGQEINVART
jgi:hypothetical protein